MVRLAAMVFVLALPLSARAQQPTDLEAFDAPPAWQPSWRFVSGAFALGSGAALLSLSIAYGQRVYAIEDRAIAVSESAKSATTEAELIRLRNRVDRLNHEGADLETTHLLTLAGGAVLFATGVVFVIWDRVRAPDPVSLTVSPLPSGLAVRLDW